MPEKKVSFAIQSQDIRQYYQEVLDVIEMINKEFINLSDVKKQIEEISSLLIFDKIRKANNFAPLINCMHLVFTGKTGTGKTVVGVKMALILRNLGYLTKGHILTVSRDDLVGQYIGHTAPKAADCLQQANGGILFIDNAYTIYQPDNERDYGSEAVEMILQVMENQRDDLVIIFSGEKEKMEKFFHTNPGISSRVGNHIHFKDYTVNDLIKIADSLLLKEYRYKINIEALKILEFYLSQLVQHETFINARTVKALVNQLLCYHAANLEQKLEEKKQLDYESFITLNQEDLTLLTELDFMNIVGTDKIKLFKNKSYE